MAITIKDIAKAAGVSKTAVSFALNNKDGVGEATKQKILEAAQNLGYKPKEQKQADKGKYTSKHLILFLNGSRSKLTSPMTPILLELLHSIEREVTKTDHTLLFKTIKVNENSEKNVFNVASQNAIGGIILNAADLEECEIETVVQLGHPVVVIEHIVDSMDVDCIVSDNYYGGYLAATHLIELGHRAIGYIQSTVHTDNFARRQEGFLAALKKHGLEFKEQQIFTAPTTIEEVEATLIDKFKKSKNFPTAFFAENDTLAIGAINSMKSIGLEVPNDVSVIGYDNAEMTSLYTSPSLTSIGIPVREYAKLAVERLCARMENPDMVSCKYILGINLVKRESCLEMHSK
mgnify:CR=1 FL=1